jgi:hypothetical protein
VVSQKAFAIGRIEFPNHTDGVLVYVRALVPESAQQDLLSYAKTDRRFGAAWKIVPSPVLPRRNSGLEGIGGAAPDLWATGFAHPGRSDRVTRPLALHWDGRAWRVVSTPALPGTQGTLGAVTAVSPTAPGPTARRRSSLPDSRLGSKRSPRAGNTHAPSRPLAV